MIPNTFHRLNTFNTHNLDQTIKFFALLSKPFWVTFLKYMPHLTIHLGVESDKGRTLTVEEISTIYEARDRMLHRQNERCQIF